MALRFFASVFTNFCGFYKNDNGIENGIESGNLPDSVQKSLKAWEKSSGKNRRLRIILSLSQLLMTRNLVNCMPYTELCVL